MMAIDHRLIWHQQLSDSSDKGIAFLRRAFLVLLLVGISGACAGCVTLPRAPFTQEEQSLASPPGFGKIRYVADSEDLALMLKTSLRPDAGGQIDVLAISGGGANGVYGAGLLSGWTKSGQRPVFQLVTGISAGALTAPFAFLGSAWDGGMHDAALGPKTSRLMQERGILGLLTPGLYSKAPLEALVRSSVTDGMIAAVAAEHAKGRRLLVGTTNLDTEQLVVWDMGAIAAKGGSEARELFATVLIASASIPGVFAPTMIDVGENGRIFSEMHVDGQTESAFFAIPQALFLAASLPAPPFHARLFVIINSPRQSRFVVTHDSTVPILERSLEAGSRAATRSAIIASAQFCQHNGCDLSVSSLPATVRDDFLDFDTAHLESVFNAGVSASTNGSAWDAPMKAVSGTIATGSRE